MVLSLMGLAKIARLDEAYIYLKKQNQKVKVLIWEG